MWRISFPPDGASELRYPQTGRYITAAYENQLSPQTALRIDGGLTGHLQSATGSDSDWYTNHVPALMEYGEFKTAGASGFLNIDWKKTTGAGSELFYGYGFRRNVLHMTSGTYYVDNYASIVPLSLPDLDSTYAITYQGPHIGVTTRSRLSPGLSLVGSLACTPLALVQGNGWWNLRSLNFIHTGIGQMWDGSIGLRFAPTGKQNAALTVGYRYQYLYLFHGVENTSSDISWDKATDSQHGLYLLGGLRF